MMCNNMVIETAQEKTIQVSKWLATQEGQKAIKDAMNQGEEIILRLKEARQISPERLREPITI